MNLNNTIMNYNSFYYDLFLNWDLNDLIEYEECLRLKADPTKLDKAVYPVVVSVLTLKKATNGNV